MSAPSAVRPPRIRPGDVVGVVAPSGAVDPDLLATGIAALDAMGFRVRTGEAVAMRSGYLAGPDEARRRDLQGMLADEGVRAVFCARGGYGSQRLVPRLDLRALARAPKLVVGYSDATALLLAVTAAGGGAVHGPMVAEDLARGLTAEAGAHLASLLGDPSYRWEVPVPVGIRPGRAAGPLLGGCLSIVAATLGTPHAPATRGAVLFLEDVNEHAYRLDRLLVQLRQAGMLDEVAGVVFGTLEGCEATRGVSALDVVREHFAASPYPVAFGLRAGHPAATGEVANMALPLGIRVELDAERGRLTALEAAVA